VWDAATGDYLTNVRAPDGVRFVSLTFTADGARLLVASDDQTLRTYDVASGKERSAERRPEPFGIYGAMAVSPDGRRVASGGYYLPNSSTGAMRRDTSVHLWPLTTGPGSDVLLRGHDSWIASAAFSADGRTLAAGAYNSPDVILWDVAGRQTFGRLSGHRQAVEAVMFSPNGRELATGSIDRTVKLWSLPSGRETLTLTGHDQRVLAVAFTPDGRTLRSIDAEGTVLTWRAVSAP
jgi:WD40 repeat protein